MVCLPVFVQLDAGRPFRPLDRSSRPKDLEYGIRTILSEGIEVTIGFTVRRSSSCDTKAEIRYGIDPPCSLDLLNVRMVVRLA